LKAFFTFCISPLNTYFILLTICHRFGQKAIHKASLCSLQLHFMSPYFENPYGYKDYSKLRMHTFHISDQNISLNQIHVHIYAHHYVFFFNFVLPTWMNIQGTTVGVCMFCYTSMAVSGSLKQNYFTVLKLANTVSSHTFLESL